MIEKRQQRAIKGATPGCLDSAYLSRHYVHLDGERKLQTMNRFLKEAIEDDLPAVVEGLIAQNPQWVNQADREGLTPLLLAVSTPVRSVECIRALIEAGADVNARIGSYTVLHWAVADLGFPHEVSSSAAPDEFLPLLVDAGARLEAEQHWGWTPLMLAIVDSGLDDVRALLKVGAEPNKVVLPNGRTAFNRGQSVLSLAWSNHDPVAIMKALLEAGADVNMRDANGQTALEHFEAIEIENYRKYEHLKPFAAIRLGCIELLRQA